jgi:DNA helicase IV
MTATSKICEFRGRYIYVKAKEEFMELNMMGLEKSLAVAVTSAKSEEQTYADDLYRHVDIEKKEIEKAMPYPRTGEYDTGIDYEDIERIEYEKGANKPYYAKLKIIKEYCDTGRLYCGHLQINNANYFLMDNDLDTKTFSKEDTYLINVDDAKYTHFVKWWRYPKGKESVVFSRNVTMSKKKVENVEIILDRRNELFSQFTDKYLLSSLLRNKDKKGIQSIIQTIQNKQDALRIKDKESSLIVQGCAGSGKTMVLLHRLRYLLFNENITDGNYLFLVPGRDFKKFISDATKDFGITEKNIFSYYDYYRYLEGKEQKNENSERNETNFAQDYLKKVYSKEYIQEIYGSILKQLREQFGLLISSYESELNKKMEAAKKDLEETALAIKRDATAKVKKATENICKYLNNKVGESYESILPVFAEIEQAYLKKEKEYETELNSHRNINITLSDNRILTNKTLNDIKGEIENEKEQVRKASIFTRDSHKYKLKKLEDLYQSTLLKLKEEIAEEDEKNFYRDAIKKYEVYEGISLKNAETIINTIKDILAEANKKIIEIQAKIDSCENSFAIKHKEEVDCLKELIVFSGDFYNTIDKNREGLIPIYRVIGNAVQKGYVLLQSLLKDNAQIEKEQLAIFGNYSSEKLWTYLSKSMFQECKNRVYKEFGVKMCDEYKHYWFLRLYCDYLMNPTVLKEKTKEFIFIDEAQDLSVAELELIQKINTAQQKPKINLFGDIDQNITAQGIKKWADVGITRDIYSLNENFRNTNQIVKYCNEKLKMQMQPVGVDMEEVSEYKDIFAAIDFAENIKNDAVFIVKDEYAEADLENLLKGKGIENYHIYTVKTVKGLEFKETFVFDDGMQRNEKYIAYTRALAKLNVIKNLPKSADREKITIVQGTDEM